MISNRVNGYLPSSFGLPFPNSFPAGTSYPLISIPLITGDITITADAKSGLCGGFVFASLDLFLSNPRKLPPRTFVNPAVPPDPSPIFNYLAQRLRDSWSGNTPLANAMEYIGWAQYPDTDFNIWFLFHIDGLARRVITQEWPKIKADIDSGMPSPLGLVMQPSCGLLDIPCVVSALEHSHQVLAYAYVLDDSDNLTLSVYDPNGPGDDSSTISVNISDPNSNLSISAPTVEALLGEGFAVRGFFRSRYTWNDPAPMFPNPPPASPANQFQFVIGTGNDDAGGGQNGSSVTATIMLTRGNSFTLTLRNSNEPHWRNYTVATVVKDIPSGVTLMEPSDISGVVINLVQGNPDWAADNWDINNISVSLLAPGRSPQCVLNLVGNSRLQDGSTGLVRLSKSPGGSGVGPSSQIFRSGTGCP